MLQTIYSKLYVEREAVTGDEFREPFAEFVAVHRQSSTRDRHARTVVRGSEQEKDGQEARPSEGMRTKADLLVAALLGNGSSKTAMVELIGIEPTTSCMPCRRSTN